MGFFTDHDMSIEESVQQLITFNLHAWETINYDINAFENIPEKYQLGNFINRIILNYAHEAKCSVDEHKEKYLCTIREYFEVKGSDNENKFLRCMIKSALNPLNDEDTYIKKRIHINKKVKSFLHKSENDMYYDSKKEYIEAIINEYVSLPFSEREKIYFKEKCEKIYTAIQNCFWMRIKVQEKEFKICAYFLETDKSTNYNYLICSESDDENNKLISFRLQHIRIISVGKEHFKKCTKAKLKDYKKQIDRLGVPYIQGTNDPMIKVKLTEQGLINYKRWINQRPKFIGNFPHTDPDGTTTLIFNCSLRQIRNYFFKFGKEALIEEPAELKELFCKDFKEALDKYEE